MKGRLCNSKIDFISIVIPLSFVDEEKLSFDMSEFGKNIPVKLLNGREQFKNGFMYEQKAQGLWIKFQCKPYKSGEHKSKISFNYKNVEGLQTIIQLIDKLFPGGYPHVLKNGHITRVDLAIDFKDVKPADFMWGVSHKYRKCQEFYNDTTGCLETIYIGSTTSEKYVVIYDRRAANKGGAKSPGVSISDAPNYDVTRVEVRLQPAIIVPLNQLSDLTKVLDTVHVLLASNMNKNIQSSLDLMMRVGNQRYLLRNQSMAEQFLPPKVCDIYRKQLMDNPIGGLCDHFSDPISELLSAHKLVA